MKFLAIVLVALAFASDNVNAQKSESLLRAQEELSLTHEFAEVLLSANRDQLSSYINRMTGELTTSFLDSYGTIREIADETRAIFADLESSFCVARIQRRWNLQYTRYGNRLSECLFASYFLLNDWTNQLNAIHATGQRTSNQVQNAGMHILSSLDNFTGRDSFEGLINRQLRQLLTLARPYQFRFEDFVSRVAREAEQTLEDLTSCEIGLVDEFRKEAEDDIARSLLCFTD